MKKLKLSTYALFTLAAILMPGSTRSAWYNFWQQQGPTAEEAMASIGQELDRIQRQTSILDQVTVNIPNEVEPLLADLDQDIKKINELYNEKKPAQSIKKVQVYVKKVIKKIESFISKKGNVLFPEEERVLSSLVTRLTAASADSLIDPEEKKNELLMSIIQPMEYLKELHKQARKDLVSVILFLDTLKYRFTQRAQMKNLTVNTMNFINSEQMQINLRAQTDILSPHNKKVLHDLADALFNTALEQYAGGLQLKNRLTKDDFKTMLELVTQARHALRPNVLRDILPTVSTDQIKQVMLDELVDSLSQALKPRTNETFKSVPIHNSPVKSS